MSGLYIPGAISFRGRSPFETAQTPGLPPQPSPTPGITFIGGAPTIGGVPLPPSDIPPQDSSAIASPIAVDPTPNYDPSQYGDSITFGVVFTGAGEALVLRRPQTTRIMLLVQNFSVLGNIFYTFDRTADNGISCIAIGAGGNRLYDSVVPQGDVHLFSTGAGTVLIEYINRDITKASYR
jgi:hypothetical protein